MRWLPIPRVLARLKITVNARAQYIGAEFELVSAISPVSRPHLVLARGGAFSLSNCDVSCQCIIGRRSVRCE